MRLLAFTVVICMSVATASLGRAQQPVAACTPQQAMEAEQRQDFNGAIRVYACLSQADPKDWRPVASIAGVYGYMNRPQDEQQWAQLLWHLTSSQPPSTFQHTD